MNWNIINQTWETVNVGLTTSICERLMEGNEAEHKLYIYTLVHCAIYDAAGLLYTKQTEYVLMLGSSSS